MIEPNLGTPFLDFGKESTHSRVPRPPTLQKMGTSGASSGGHSKPYANPWLWACALAWIAVFAYGIYVGVR